MRNLNRISIDPARMNGHPTIRNLRLIGRRVIELLALDPNHYELRQEYPELEAEDIHQALRDAANDLDDCIGERAA